MKLEVNLTKLGEAVSTAPAEVQTVSQAAVNLHKKTYRPWKEQMSEAAQRAYDDVAEMLEYETNEKGEKVSKISEQARTRINQFLMEQHPDGMRSQNQGTKIVVVVDAEQLNRARLTGQEMDRRKAIDVSPENPG